MRKLSKYLKKIYFYSLRYLIGTVAKAIGPIRAPFTHKALTYEDVIDIRTNIKIGDILLSRTHGELTTLVIPGFWKHAMVYVGEDKIIEAVGSGVKISYLVDSVMRTDNLVVLRKKNGLTPTQTLNLTNWIFEQIGKLYDYSLYTESSSKFYCSELAIRAIESALETEYFQPMSRLGFMTVTPDDIYMAKNKMEIIWEKRS